MFGGRCSQPRGVTRVGGPLGRNEAGGPGYVRRVPHAEQQRVALDDVKPWRHTTVGHLLHLEAPDDVNRRILELIA